MRREILAWLVAVTLALPATADQRTYTPEQAKQHRNDTVTICGDVARVEDSGREPRVFFTTTSRDPIWAIGNALGPPTTTRIRFLGARVCVTGRVYANLEGVGVDVGEDATRVQLISPGAGLAVLLEATALRSSTARAEASAASNVTTAVVETPKHREFDWTPVLVAAAAIGTAAVVIAASGDASSKTAAVAPRKTPPRTNPVRAIPATSMPLTDGGAPLAPLATDLLVFGGQNHTVFLGCLTCGSTDPDAISNAFGPHGNRFAADTLTNRFSEYGSRFSMHSACNPYATEPPAIVDRAGGYYGELTSNPYAPRRAVAWAAWLAAVCAGQASSGAVPSGENETRVASPPPPRAIQAQPNVPALAPPARTAASAAAGGFVARGLNVAIIAPSVSTSMEAQRIRRQLSLYEVPFKEAEAILVVVRSGLTFPLRDEYDSVKELREDAERQLNISGDEFHLYLYDLRDDLSVASVAHRHYPARD